MSDSRFHLEVKFDVYGKTFNWKPSLNWYDNGDGIDQRIVDWFRESYNDALWDFEEGMRKWQKEETERLAAEKERKEYARLKAKFEGANDVQGK